MDSNVAQNWKEENHNSNINNVYTTFKGTFMMTTEVLKWDGTTKYLHYWMLLMAKYCYLQAREF